MYNLPFSHCGDKLLQVFFFIVNVIGPQDFTQQKHKKAYFVFQFKL